MWGGPARRRIAAAILASGTLGMPPAARAAPPVGRGGLCATVSGGHGAPRLAVLSAFPAELGPLVAAADVTETVTAGGRTYHLGTLAGVCVVLGLTGIGLVNAEKSARDLLRHFRLAAVVFSGVAGSPHRIGDVVVPAEWVEGGRRKAVPTNPALLELARQAAAGVGALERCTPLSATFGGGTVCLPHEPVIAIGGRGRSADPFGGAAVPCQPGGDEVFGCELPSPRMPMGWGTSGRRARPDRAPLALEAEDMETAAVARIASRRGVPFLAFRAVSDGAGDPLGLPGFPSQFFAYYRLAAANAAAGTVAFLARLADLGQPTASGERICRLLARGRWRRAARLLTLPLLVDQGASRPGVPGAAPPGDVRRHRPASAAELQRGRGRLGPRRRQAGVGAAARADRRCRHRRLPHSPARIAAGRGRWQDDETGDE
jgi:nucleoside phosphorylase